MNEIRRHMEEYLESKNNIRSKFRRKTQFHPENFADFIKNSLIKSKSPESFKERLGGSNVRARKAHDYYGWMSKKGRLGACRGAIYRSQEYMKIPLRDRSGEKKYKSRGEQYSSYHVHIEHSIPVNTILEYFWQHKDILLEMDKQRKLHETFLSISVCTALTRNEEKSCIKNGLSKKHPEFENGKILTNSLTDIHPFKRYDFSNGLKVYEVITGTKICPESFTLRDHIDLMAEADIFNWDNILSYYQSK
tara:strand:+ start:2615 stop:3361 length:747 start_codon:yes stop_codon:yes gene_type:complete